MTFKETLSYFCGKSVENALVEISEDFLKDKNITFNNFSKQIEGLKRHLCGVSSPCHDVLAQHCLKAADRLTDDLSSDSTELVCRNQFVIQQLVSMVTHLKTRELHFNWSKPVEEVLLDFLWRMTHLEDLTFSWWDESIDFKPRLLESLPFLTNLTRFSSETCTDEIIAALCENCEHLAYISWGLDSNVTDTSIDSLILCKNLTSVDFVVGGVTEAGMAKLLVKSQSKNIKYIDPFGFYSCNFLEYFETEAAPLDTFQLRHFKGCYIDGKHLPLICKYFPCLEFLSLSCSLTEWPDFSCLDCLANIVALNLYIHLPFDHTKRLYSLKCQNLTCLELTDMEISLAGLINIGGGCPNLTSLNLWKCSVLKDMQSLTASTSGKPFEKLLTVWFDLKSSASGVKLILMHAINIRIIQLSAISGVTDEFLTDIFKVNKLGDLEILKIWPRIQISVKMLKSIIQRCKKIKELGKFALPDDGDAGAKDEFECLQKFITENKHNVQLL